MRKNQYFRRFGFELEFSTQFDDVEAIIKQIIPKIYGKNKLIINSSYEICNEKFKKWELKRDGSTECELTTPISTSKDFTQLKNTLDEIKNKKIKVTRKDSVHVHMQADDVPKHNIIAAWIQIEPIILQFFPKHRRNNSFCEKIIKNRKYQKISDFFIKAEAKSFNHHSIVSLNYYLQRETVEFRIMEGNTSFEDVKAWIKFLMIFLEYAKNIDPVEIICKKINKKMNIKKMIDLLNINDREVIDFLERRKEEFRD